MTENLKAEIKAGDKLTFVFISGMASTSKQEVKVIKVDESGIIYKVGRKRALYHKEFPLPNDLMIFKGHNIPLKTDWEFYGNTFMANACFNLGGLDQEAMKKYIEEKNLNNHFSKLSHILFMTTDIDNPIVLYPELEASHAVINRHKDKSNV